MNNTMYITTSILYPNANPHLGYAMELVQADFLARYYGCKGLDVRLVTGIDEHGLKIQNKAKEEGLTPKEYVDNKSWVIAELNQKLLINSQRLIRTTDQDHIQMAQELWSACFDRGDIYSQQYKAWYNIKEEEYLGLYSTFPDPAVFGVDQKFIELIDERNYFFSLSKYKNQIVAMLEEGALEIVPEHRKTELLMFVKDRGLQDISVSRDVGKLSWGIPVPNDPSQVMYVWFDALTNYLTASRTSKDQWWPASLHILGKDILRFHGLIWPAMLMSAGYVLPKKMLVHGFIEADGQKMSKSIGNVVDPLPIIKEYGADALRWYLLREIGTTDDGDYTQERFLQTYNSSLANDYGNLVSRVWTMLNKYSGGQVPMVEVSSFGNVEEVVVSEIWSAYMSLVEEYKIHLAIAKVQELIVFCNRRIDEMKPWVLAKDLDKKRELDELLYEMIEIIRHITLMLSPVLVETTQKIRHGIFFETEDVIWGSFERGLVWGLLSPGMKLGDQQVILFPKKND